MSRKKFTEVKQLIGLRIKKIRGTITYDEFSEGLGVSTSYVSMVEKGQRGPGFDILYSLKDKFGISIDNLLTTDKDITFEHIDMLENKIMNIIKALDKTKKEDVLRYAEEREKLMAIEGHDGVKKTA